MKQLIKITEHEGKQAVSARELYMFLKVNTNFTTWCSRMFEYGFEEQIDFIPFLEESTGGRPRQDFALTINCAKEISMLQRNEQGKIARNYFIECQERLKELENQPKKQMTPAEQLLQNAQILVAQERKLLEHDDRINQLEAKQVTRPDVFTVAGYGTLHQIEVNMKMASSLGRKASKLCRDREIEVDTIPDPRFGRVNVYPAKILEEVFNMKLTV